MSDRLLVALSELPVEWPVVPEVSVGTAADPEPGIVLRRSSFVFTRVAVAVFALVVGVLGFVTPVREAIADWLGIGVVRVEIVDTVPEDLGSVLDIGDPADVGSLELRVPVGLGEPTAAFRREGEISVVWSPSDDLPEVTESGVGAILTRFDGVFDPAVEKSLSAASTLQVVIVDGARAYWIEGEPHSFVYLDDQGRPVETGARLAGNTLIWEQDGSTFRFESGLSLEAVLGLLHD